MLQNVPFLELQHGWLLLYFQQYADQLSHHPQVKSAVPQFSEKPLATYLASVPSPNMRVLSCYRLGTVLLVACIKSDSNKNKNHGGGWYLYLEVLGELIIYKLKSRARTEKLGQLKSNSNIYMQAIQSGLHTTGLVSWCTSIGLPLQRCRSHAFRCCLK